MSRKKVVEDNKEEIKKPKKTKKETNKKSSKVTKEEIVKEEKVTKSTKKRTTVKVEKNNPVLSKKEQKTLKVLCRIVSVITKILKVCAMIIVPIIAVVAILIPIVLSKVEVNGNIVKFNDVRFVMSNESVTAHVGDKTFVISDNVKNMDKLVDFLNSNTISKLLISLELTLIFTIIIIIINIYLLGYASKLFNNFYQGKTPFTDENNNYIRKIGRIMICSLIASFVFEFVLFIFVKDAFAIHFGTRNIIAIIVIYIMYYIFLYATKLQKENDTSIYN